VTPPITGETLTETVRRNGPLRPDATLHLLDIIARGLGKAHQVDLVHLFLTPDSIRITDTGPVIVDLALPDNVGGLELFGFPDGFIGDLRTAAPERFDLKPISPSSDIYSLGLVFSFTLTGQLPILDREPAHAWITNVTEDVPNPRVSRPDLPEPYVGLLAKLTARDPRGRYQGMFDILADLELVRAGSSPDSIPPFPETENPRPNIESISWPEDKPKGSNTLIFVNAFLGLIVLLMLYLVSQSSPDKDFFKNLPIVNSADASPDK